MEENKVGKEKTMQREKRRAAIISACLIGALILCAVLIFVLESLDNGEYEYETLPPVPDNKLYDTYPEDFDIMEYGEYLSLDRSIYHCNTTTGVTVSIDAEEAEKLGEAFAVLYDVIIAINEGDSETYNSYMGSERLKKGDFTQQQIYDIVITPAETKVDGGYETLTYKVTYRIHENNGTYRNTIESDVRRPQYFILDNSTGDFLVTDIREGYHIVVD